MIQSVMTVFLAKVLTNLNALHLTHYEYVDKFFFLSIFEVYFKFAKQKTNLFIPQIIIELRIGRGFHSLAE